ncbi:mitochondrial ribosomal protein subunit S18 [Desarmillaria tabescens]|uniref:Mitochondrial ribosomal protein subunit S18 n=1 Tax=Armillaria tabescens TaxID=1929756 RepID=A0AA39NLW8_ARMTA|nr:mitochondrial ribosomal protein subunit S18 [Desarmillaria tabescens]KAK0468063.1 mitochondrial ribosomal protein subunit S18 [Desarmillaria tabescens]
MFALRRLLPRAALQTRSVVGGGGAHTIDSVIGELNADLTASTAVSKSVPPAPSAIDTSLPPSAPSHQEKPATPLDPVDRRNWPVYRLHCQATPNNTLLTFTTPDGCVKAWASAGSCGFKNTRRGSPEGAYAASVKIFEKILAVTEGTEFYVHLFLKGFGLGRNTLVQTLASTEGESVRRRILYMTDRTPIKIGGTRAKKMRRI